MPKVPLIARKDQTYMTRRLKAGTPFMARSEAEARILRDVGKARDDYDAPVTEALAATPVAPVYVPAQPPTSPPSVPAPPQHDPLDALRGEAAALGVHVDRRWGEARLAQEIDAALERPPKEETPETPTTETPEAVAMTTDSASVLMPRSWRHDEE